MSTTPKVKEARHVGESISAGNASWSFSGDVRLHFLMCKTVSASMKPGVTSCLQGVTIFFKMDPFATNSGYRLVRLLKMSDRFGDKKVRFIGIDQELSMVEQAKKEIGKRENVELLVDDINLHEYEPADLIISYYTVQFVPPKQRQKLINKIYESLNWGVGFYFFEKVRAGDARFQDMMTGLYTDFKIDQGYDNDEIIGKTRSLKGSRAVFD